MKHELKLKRVYETPDRDDGRRILVDRLWPRGLTKEKAKINRRTLRPWWLKETFGRCRPNWWIRRKRKRTVNLRCPHKKSSPFIRRDKLRPGPLFLKTRKSAITEKTTRARSSSRGKKIIKIYPLRFAFWPLCESSRTSGNLWSR